jgi:membrane-bound lytic murein transglycosylase A
MTLPVELGKGLLSTGTTGMQRSAYHCLRLLAVAFLIALAAASCAPTSAPVPLPLPVLPPAVLQRLDATDYPRVAGISDAASLMRSVDMSLVYFRRQPADRLISFGADTYTVAHLVRSLETFRTVVNRGLSEDALNQVLQDQFAVYRAVGGDGDNAVLFTGYYEPILKGGLQPTARYKVPVYSRPRDLITIDLSPFAEDLNGRSIVGRYTGQTVVPYPTREQIQSRNDFSAVAPPIAWLEDAFDLFNLQVQGSGRIELENGDQVNILYDGSNQRPYRSIGRLLIAQGRIAREKLTLQSIRAYLNDNPESVDAILNYNPRYVFFRIADDGPLGAMGQPLTPLRSIAIDRDLFPLGALCYVETPLAQVTADGTISGWQRHRGFALAQDTGGAIKGPGRVDLFMGNGRQAETAAGHLKHSGALYFFVLNTDSGPSTQ